jgi:hypothetical protein
MHPQLSRTVNSSQSHIATDGHSASKSSCRAPSGAHDLIFITVWQLLSCFCGAPSLTRGRVWLLYMLLVFASAVFLGSESLGTRDHILLSQIWDFPFRRLLRLAGSRWRYTIPPPHGDSAWIAPVVFKTTPRHGPHGKRLPYCWEFVIEPLHSSGHGTDPQKTSYVIPSQRLHWRWLLPSNEQ